MIPKNKYRSGVILAMVFLVGVLVLIVINRPENDFRPDKGTITSTDQRRVNISRSRRDVSPPKSTRLFTIENLPLDISSWIVSNADKKLFTDLDSRLTAMETLRIIDKSHTYSELEPSTDYREMFNVHDSIKTIEVLAVTTALRPPDPAELARILEELEMTLADSSVSEEKKPAIRQFFEERFSLDEKSYKILTTNAKKIGVGDEVRRNTYAVLCDEFVAEGEEGRKKIKYVGDFTIEDSKMNPVEFASRRYGHLVDIHAGE